MKDNEKKEASWYSVSMSIVRGGSVLTGGKIELIQNSCTNYINENLCLASKMDLLKIGGFSDVNVMKYVCDTFCKKREEYIENMMESEYSEFTMMNEYFKQTIGDMVKGSQYFNLKDLVNVNITRHDVYRFIYVKSLYYQLTLGYENDECDLNNIIGKYRSIANIRAVKETNNLWNVLHGVLKYDKIFGFTPVDVWDE